MPTLSSLLQCGPLPLPVDSCVSQCVSHALGCRYTDPCCDDRTILLSQFFGSVFLLLSEIWELLNLGFVQTVDDGVLSLCDIDALDLLLVLEADLTGGHAAVLFQV